MIRGLLSLYSWRYPSALVYMLQSTEYHAGPYLRWYWQTNDFRAVAKRRTLDYTRAARLLLFALRLGMLAQVLAGVALVYWGYQYDLAGGWQFGLALIIGYPVVWAHLAVVPLTLGRWLIARPKQARLIKASERIFAHHPGAKIAIVGSYGKTSMKELLLTVLQEGKDVAATPANKNVAISHAYFARKLSGKEDVVIIEYGEGAPGDVARFARVTHPTHAIITGVAPAHLDQYKTVERATNDIFSVTRFVVPKQVYVNTESPLAQKHYKPDYQAYNQHEVMGWKVSRMHITLDGTRFTMSKGKLRLELHSGLLGAHQVGPLALAAALAYEFGMTPKQIQAGIAKTQPFEHRMQPYNLAGAWIIDDTYNGNIEGIRVGLDLLGALPGKRKIYVTPGLVDQGEETQAVHQSMGRLIAAAHPDIVVLMDNSATASIQAGLAEGKYAGQVVVAADPLEFYTNLPLFVANGDLVLMQNDWTDNYR